CSLLHAGPQPDSRSWTHGAVRSIRNARAWTHAVLPARSKAGPAMEARSAEGVVLVHQSRPRVHGRSQHVSYRAAAGGGVRPTRNLVCAIRRVSAVRTYAGSALDAGTGRRPVRDRSCPPGLVCARAADRTLL